MPDEPTGVKISLLPTSGDVTDSDMLAGVQSNTTVKFFFSAIKTWIKAWIGKADVGLNNVDNIKQYSASNPPVSVGAITLSATWTGASSPYSQTVTVSGATVTANSKVDIQLTAAQIADLIAAGVKSLFVENNAGTLTAWAVGGTTSAEMTVQCTVEDVSV